MRLIITLLVTAGILAGCSSVPRREPAPVVPQAATPSDERGPDLGTHVATLAASLVGRPYRFGGATPDGFVCSGLVYYVYSTLGLSVPRTAALQRAAIERVAADELRPGDLVFFYMPRDHVGIYLGGGEFVHAPASGRTVQRARLDAPFYVLGYAGGGRLPLP